MADIGGKSFFSPNFFSWGTSAAAGAAHPWPQKFL